MYQPYLFIYRMNDLKTEMEIQKFSWTTRLGSRRVEDAKGVHLNTILIKLKCGNTQHKMDCIQPEFSLQLQRLTQVHWYLKGSLQFQQKKLLFRLSDLQFQNNLKARDPSKRTSVFA